MSKAITIYVSDDLEAQIDELSSADGVSPKDWIQRALKAHVFIRRFRAAREDILRELDERGERYTDEDVFKMVS